MSKWTDVADYKPKRCLSHPLPKSDRTGSEAAMTMIKQMSIKQRRDRNWERDEDLGDLQISVGAVFRRRGDLIYTMHKHFAGETEDTIHVGDDCMTWDLETRAHFRGLRDPDGFDWRGQWSHNARVERAAFALATRNAADKRRPR